MGDPVEIAAKTAAQVEIVATLPLEVNQHSVIVQESMNYIRSRFLNREALQRSNPLNSAENVLRYLI